MKIAIVKDYSSKYDPADWCNVYSEIFQKNGVETEILDFSIEDWIDEIIKRRHYNALLWRVWHRPDDLHEAKTKIALIERECNLRCFPSSSNLWSYNDKERQFYLSRFYNFPMPRTLVSRNKDEAVAFAISAGFPLVLKAPFGACGENIWLLRNMASLMSYLEAIFSSQGMALYDPITRLRGVVYLQEYIKSIRDLRIITVGNEVALAFWRKSEGWKHNISLGASIEVEGIPEKAINLALTAAKKIDFPWCAFDFIENNDNLILLEFSVQFGFSSPNKYTHLFGDWDGKVLSKQVDYIIKYLTYEKKNQ
jgi:glutathione synthase/RimK-type ligase-like ATP-grasp enzyme